MAVPQLSLKTASVVALGNFDVRLFTPIGLLKGEVVTVSELLTGDSLTAIPGRMVSFETEALKVAAHANRVSIEALVPPYIKAVDVLSKTLKDSDSPGHLTAIGINVHAFYTMSYDVRDRLGRRLAPVDAWGKWSEQLRKAQSYPPDDPKHAGMTGVSMRLPLPDNRENGWIEVRVEPSSRTKGVPEMAITINDHYSLKEGDEDAAIKNPLALLELAEARFDASLQRSDEIISFILEQAK